MRKSKPVRYIEADDLYIFQLQYSIKVPLQVTSCTVSLIKSNLSCYVHHNHIHSHFGFLTWILQSKSGISNSGHWSKCSFTWRWPSNHKHYVGMTQQHSRNHLAADQ